MNQYSGSGISGQLNQAMVEASIAKMAKLPRERDPGKPNALASAEWAEIALNELQGAIADLERKLAPITGPNQLNEASKGSANPMPATSDLTAQLDRLARHAAELTTRVSELSRRIEL